MAYYSKINHVDKTYREVNCCANCHFMVPEKYWDFWCELFRCYVDCGGLCDKFRNVEKPVCKKN